LLAASTDCRSGTAVFNGGGDVIGIGANWSGAAAKDRKPATIDEAPKRMKQPITTLTPRRKSTRPVSIIMPTVATAMIATVVAMVPRSVPCSHCTAETIGCDPWGSVSEYTYLITACAMKAHEYPIYD
jgi:hypothetical protein